jgi:hypothetical protein
MKNVGEKKLHPFLFPFLRRKIKGKIALEKGKRKTPVLFCLIV